MVRLEKWVQREFVHGIAARAPFLSKGRLSCGSRCWKAPQTTAALAPKFSFGTSHWHGLILGGRALDCAGRMGLGFRPGPDFHVLDTLGIRMPRCEDHTRSQAWTTRHAPSLGAEGGAGAGRAGVRCLRRGIPVRGRFLNVGSRRAKSMAHRGG